MSEKRKFRTLIARNGHIWIEGEEPPLTLISARKPLADEDEFFELMKNLFKQRITVPRESRGHSYVTFEDFDELEKRVKALEKRIDKRTKVLPSGEIYAALNYFISQTENLKGIKGFYYQHEGKNLDFFLVADQFTSDLLENISEIEIDVSRKFMSLSVNIEPVFSEEEIPRGSYSISVKR